MASFRLVPILAGALVVSAIGFLSTAEVGPGFIAGLAGQAAAARDRAGGKGIRIAFTTPQGALTRHPVLSGGDGLDAATRARAAAAIADVPGIGGAQWATNGRHGKGASANGVAPGSMHCQQDVDAILQARTIRFSEASASIDPASRKLLDEVAAALRPCVGSIIAITGHTDSAGDEAANLALSQARAEAVRWALIARGIPADGLRTAGKGSREPLKGLDPRDPANRRIEFSVIETVPLKPTPVDTPGPG